MDEKFEADSPQEDPSPYSWREAATAEQLRQAVAEEREWDLRIRMVALDQAVAALPHLVSGIEGEEFKIGAVKRAAREFEKVLRGES